MVKVRLDPNAPIAFSDQIVAYAHDGTLNERIFVDIAQRVITVANPNPTTDLFYINLSTGALPRRDKVSADGKVEIINIGTTTNPQSVTPNL